MDVTSGIKEKIKSEQRSWLYLYLIEVFEAMVAIIVIRVALDKPIIFPKLLQESCLIGLLTLVLELYSPDYNTSVKSGLTFSVGTSLINQHLTTV